MKNRHGGDIYRLLERGFNYEDILDLSASINPLGTPKGVIELLMQSAPRITHYPDPYSRRLRKAIAEYHDIDPALVIVGNGSTELIYLVARALRPERVIIPLPTFSEYERAVELSGAKVLHFKLKEEENFDISPEELIGHMKSLVSQGDMVFLCNPNNPTGRLLERRDVLRLAEVSKDMGIFLVVDEAFIDFIPHESVIKEVKDNSCLIVLRSMTKFYGLAGLRLGYGVFHKAIVDRIWRYKEPWTVNSLAEEAGIISLEDRRFNEETRMCIHEWSLYLEDLFKRYRIEYIPSFVNFYLFKLMGGKRNSQGKDIEASLADRGILIRDCSDFRGLKRGWFRIAVRRPEEISRLFEELSKWV